MSLSQPDPHKGMDIARRSISAMFSLRQDMYGLDFDCRCWVGQGNGVTHECGRRFHRLFS